MTHKYNYFYKITNRLNDHFYYGVHSTDNLEDGYMGSGIALHKAYDKDGISNFEKEIIKFFDTMDEAYEYEALIVNEDLVKEHNCYNIALGGRYFSSIEGQIAVRYKNTSDQYFVVTSEEYYINKDLYEVYWQGKHHSKESKDAVRKKMTPENSTNKRIWINKDGKVKYLLKEKLDEYLNDGWELGRMGYKPKSWKQFRLEKEQIKAQEKIEIEKKKQKQQQQGGKEKYKLEQQQKKQYCIDAIIFMQQNSGIDFSKYGWCEQAKQYLQDNYGIIIVERLTKMIKRYYPEFFNDNVYVRK